MIDPHHFIYDFCQVHHSLLSDKGYIATLICGVVAKINMTPCGEIVMEQMIDPEKPECNGITAIQILKESLIDIHTYPENGIIYIGIFSCRPFNSQIVYNYLINSLSSRWGYMNRIHRPSKKP